MGINGLLKALSPLLVPENYDSSHPNANNGANNGANPSHHTYTYNIQQFANKSLAIDASSWLFKASYSCAEKLVEGIESNPNYIDPQTERKLCNYMIRRCEELIQHASIRNIYLVFDGKRCPLKDITNKQREERRRECLREARRFKAMGRADLAGDKYKACVKVTDRMAECVAKAVQQKWGVASISSYYNNLSSQGDSSCSGSGNGNDSDRLLSQSQSQSRYVPQRRVTCVFSPYEADAQLIKLCIDGITDAIVTEDSDVLVYSAACNVTFPVIYKLSRDDGSCDVLTMDWLLSSPSPSSSASTATVQNSDYPSFRRHLVTRNHRCHNSTTEKNRKGDSSKKKKQKTGPGAALLSHLHALSSRERRQKGSGARMFVQACVLAGCDYAPSRLIGVGLVTAFKMIKENAHRNVGTRFSNVLNSVPREKILLLDDGKSTSSTGTVNISTSVGGSVNACTPSPKTNGGDISHAIQTYETLLAKSEAVFYYHHVRRLESGNIVPLNERHQDLTDKGSHWQFLPCTSRFDDDISFTGTDFDAGISSIYASSTNNAGTIKKALSVSSAIPTNPYSVKRSSPFDSNNVLRSKKIGRHSQNINTASTTISPEEKYKKKCNIRSFLKAKNKDGRQPVTLEQEKQQASSTEKSDGINFSKYTFSKSPGGNDTPRSKQDGNVATKSPASSKSNNRQQRTNDSDSDSDDNLDESSDHFYFMGRTNSNRQCSIITPSITVRDSQTSYTSLSSSESLSLNKNDSRTSKYFNFDAISDRRSDSDDSLDQILSPVDVSTTFAPKRLPNNRSEENGEMNKNRECFHTKTDTNEDSNDCMIMDNPHTKDSKCATSTSNPKTMPSNRQSSHSIFDKHQSQTQRRDGDEDRTDFPNKPKATVSRFFSNPVQRERSRDEFFPSWAKRCSSESTSKKDQKQHSVAMSSSVKKRKRTTTSIKSFFVPLNTTKKS